MANGCLERERRHAAPVWNIELAGGRMGKWRADQRRLVVDCFGLQGTGVFSMGGATGFSRFHLTRSGWLAWGRAEILLILTDALVGTRCE